MIHHLFCGIRGWEALTSLQTFGYDIDPYAINTGAMNGFLGECQDLLEVSPPFESEGLIASPPCPIFSNSGNKSGLPEIPRIIDRLYQYLSTTKYSISLSLDAELLVLPMRWIYTSQPDFVVMEQVPSVLPVFKAYEGVLRGFGYSTASGILRAESFGLGSVRKRAFFVASKTRLVSLPIPTHSSFNSHRPESFDNSLPKWNSMADTLGWGMTHRPAPTVTAGGTSTGGYEAFGNGARQMLKREYEAGRWIGEFNSRPSIDDLKKLMGFPAGFCIAGKDTQIKRQIGNAVPPIVGRKVLEGVGCL